MDYNVKVAMDPDEPNKFGYFYEVLNFPRSRPYVKQGTLTMYNYNGEAVFITPITRLIWVKPTAQP